MYPVTAPRVEQAPDCHPEEQDGADGSINSKRKTQRPDQSANRDRQPVSICLWWGLVQTPDFSLAATSASIARRLHRRTRNVTVRTEDATVSRSGLQDRLAILTVVEILASI